MKELQLDSIADSVRAAERARAAAVVARDCEALSGWLHDDLVYVHATGLCHDRNDLLKFVAEGPRFLDVELHPHTVEVHDRVAIVVGELSLVLKRTPGAESRSVCRARGSIKYGFAGQLVGSCAFSSRPVRWSPMPNTNSQRRCRCFCWRERECVAMTSLASSIVIAIQETS